MNERALKRLFRGILLASVPIAASLACGGAISADEPADGGGGGAGSGAGAGGKGDSTTLGSSTTVGVTTVGSSTTLGGPSVVTVVGPSVGSTGGGAGTSGSGGVGGEAGGLNDNPCSNVLRSPCSSCIVLDAGALVLDGGNITDCNSLCGAPSPVATTAGGGMPMTPCMPVLREGRAVAVVCNLGFWNSCAGPATGRRPAGLIASNESPARDAGTYFAEIALLEAASVDAFLVLRDELLFHGAPLSLVRAAERAARDEVRHAQITGSLARRYGSNALSARVEKRPIRSLREIALENATEGCVRETFGALLASHQARAAKSRLVRSAFAVIAEDETRHAALAWKVAAWLDGKLDDEERARVREARRSAAKDLTAAVRTEPPPWAEDVGLPNREASSQMADQMTQSLWS